MFWVSANLAKCEVFYADVKGEVQKEICEFLRMEKGLLPLKYLGIPIYSTKLKYIKCKSLIEKITKPITHWIRMFLSYGDRVSLISSALNGIKSYWDQVFYSP